MCAVVDPAHRSDNRPGSASDSPDVATSVLLSSATKLQRRNSRSASTPLRCTTSCTRYFLGLRWMHTINSCPLSGVGSDAGYLAEQAGHSVATPASHDAGVLKEPRKSRESGPRMRSETLALNTGVRRMCAKPRPTQSMEPENPLPLRYGRCWARTNDLRLVETVSVVS